MPFHLKHFQEHVKRLVKGVAQDKLMQAGEAYKSLTVRVRKTIAIQHMMELLDRDVAVRTRRELMESCGRQCMADSILKKALRLKDQTNDLDDLLVRLNEARIGGGLLRRKGNVIHAEYHRCYCGSVSGTRQKFSPTYCYCSCGWYKELFETILNKPVRVELLGSIIQGDQCCQFKIHFGRARDLHV